MKIQLKKIIAGIVSVTMLSASFAAFAADNNMTTDSIDAYLVLDDGTKMILPDEEGNDVASDNDSVNNDDASEEEVKPTNTPTEKPETTLAPEVTAEPETTEMPEATTKPTEMPEAAEKLETTPESVMTPEATVAPTETTETESKPSNSDWDNELTNMVQLYAVSKSGKCGDNLTWTLDGDGTLTISGTGAMYDYSNVDVTTAPWGNYADDLKKLVLNNGITYIGNNAFAECTGLTGQLVIPNSVTSIGQAAFCRCSGFTGKLVIPDSVTSVGSSAFSTCTGLTGLVISNNVTSIESSAFSQCYGCIGDLVIPDSVTSIGSQAFYRCGFTGNLVLPDSVTSIGYNAFGDCSGFTGNLTIPNSITGIGGFAFSDCNGFTGLVISDGVRSIDERAFNNCSGFTGNLVIPDSVTSIGNAAFFGCTGISDMYIQQAENKITTGSFSNRIHWKYDLSKCTATISNSYNYTGTAIVPNQDSITVKSPNGKTLYYGTDYIIESASNNVNAGTATAHIVPPTGGISILSQDVPFEIVGIDLSGATVTFPSNITYRGEPCTPEPTVVVDGKTLTKGTDYTVSYANNNGVGTATANISGIGGYVGTIGKLFKIVACPISSASVGNIADQRYTGSAVTPTVSVSLNGTTLVKGTDYTVSYSNNVNVGTATVTITGKGNFSGTTTKTFKITGINISGATVTFPEDISYQGEPCKPEPTVVVNGKTLVKGTDYTIEYSNNNGVGTGTAVISGIGSYIGSVTEQFEIQPFKPGGRGSIDITDNTLVEASVSGSFVFSGTTYTPKPVLVYHFVNPTTHVALDYAMVEGTDYEIVSYSNNVNAGTAKIKVRGIGTFENEKTIGFRISPCELSATTIADIPSHEYCKEDICPEPEIKIGDVVLAKDVDYTLSYENNRNRGTASVIITGKGNLSGTVTKTFEITPRDGSRFTIIVWL